METLVFIHVSVSSMKSLVYMCAIENSLPFRKVLVLIHEIHCNEIMKEGNLREYDLSWSEICWRREQTHLRKEYHQNANFHKDNVNFPQDFLFYISFATALIVCLVFTHKVCINWPLVAVLVSKSLRVSTIRIAHHFQG